MDIARQQRVIKLFDEALEWPRAARVERLTDLLSGEPELLSEVLAMIAADDSSALLPTLPPEPAALIPDAPMPQRIGNYRIIEEIGRGGMGLVYRGARDDGLFEQQVAIKVIRRNVFSATTQEQFANERRILARLHHPHIAHLLDGGVSEDGASYIIMELINGTPITDYAEAHALDLAARLALFGDACSALEYAHRELVVHADVKPSNVVVAEGFGVKLLDFGIARLVGEDGGRASSAHTPGYSSPARISGERSTPTDDVYALGVLLQALIDGVAGVDGDLLAVAAKAASDDVAVRYGAVSELVDDLARWQRHEPVTACAPDRQRWMLLLWRRNRLAILAGLLLSATALATTFLYVRAEAQRVNAERRFDDVRSMANYMMFDLDPQLARLTGSLPARRSAAQKAGQYLQALGADARNNPELALEIVRSHLRLANIYGYDPSGGLSDIPKANHHLAMADAILRSYPDGSGDRAAFALATGEYQLTRAASYLVSESADSLPKANKSLADARAQFDRVLLAEPGNIYADYGKWRAAIYQIRLLIYAGKSAEAVAIGIAERDRKRPTPRSPGQQIEFDFLSTIGLTGLAQAQYEEKQYYAALETFKNAERALRAIIAAGRGGFETRSFLTVALSGIGDCYQKLGNREAAIRYNRLSLETMLDLRKAGPNDSLEEDIVATQMALSVQLAESGQAEEATQLIQMAAADSQDRVRRNTKLPATQRRLAIVMQTRANIGFILGDRKRACQDAQRAKAQWEVAARLGGILEFDRDENGGVAAMTKLQKQCGTTE
jgi:eukaryotic-like serine/threonine-protein kinase